MAGWWRKTSRPTFVLTPGALILAAAGAPEAAARDVGELVAAAFAADAEYDAKRRFAAAAVDVRTQTELDGEKHREGYRQGQHQRSYVVYRDTSGETL